MRFCQYDEFYWPGLFVLYVHVKEDDWKMAIWLLAFVGDRPNDSCHANDSFVYLLTIKQH